MKQKWFTYLIPMHIGDILELGHAGLMSFRVFGDDHDPEFSSLNRPADGIHAGQIGELGAELLKKVRLAESFESLQY